MKAEGSGSVTSLNVFPLAEKYFRVKSILDSSNSQKVGFFNVTDILNVVICRWEDCPQLYKIFGNTAQISADSGTNPFSGEPQLLRVISKGTECTAHILYGAQHVHYVKPLPFKAATLIIYQP